MNAPACSAPIVFARLLEYWLGELDEANEALVDEHLLGCDECSENLQSLLGLAGGVRSLVAQGAVRAVVTDAYLARLAAHGLRLREYRVPCNGSVHCTIAPDDDLIVARLQAPLEGVERVDAVLLEFDESGAHRLQDIPFDSSTREVVFTPRVASIRDGGPWTARLQLIAVDRQSERLLGEYTFIHTPWPGR